MRSGGSARRILKRVAPTFLLITSRLRGCQFFQDVVNEAANMVFLGSIVAARCKGFGSYTLLDKLTDYPVLPVDQVEDFNGIHGVKVCASHHSRVEQPGRGDASQRWPERV